MKPICQQNHRGAQKDARRPRRGAKLSDRQKANFANQTAGLAKGYYDLANTAGVPLPGPAEATGRREDAFVQSRHNLFYADLLELDKRQKGSQFGGNPHTPDLQNGDEALLTGNANKATQIGRPLQVDEKLSPQQLHISLEEIS